MPSLLRLGTRGSKLALIQARETASRLDHAHADLAAPDAVEIVPITTTGDSVQNRLLSEIGGKGLFTKEIDEALLAGRVDIAVHSMKDLPTALPVGVIVGAVLPREDPRDALIGATRIADLPRGATLGTASLRRAAQVKAQRPDLAIVPLRGNVDTRLRKIAAGEAQATILAVAGLKRMGLMDEGSPLSFEEMLPSVAQGAIAVACRAGDTRTLERLAAIDDEPSRLRVTAEREMLAVLDGSCRTPIAGLAEIEGASLRIRGLVASVDGTRVDRGERRGAAADAEALGRALGEALKAGLPR
ncbi:MAG: hydroxymethylbilane synthase [Alphaproteobacteria bacterium]|nr:hydroxymethylbilane synthase [Alphaproteobacteria bacterium]